VCCKQQKKKRKKQIQECSSFQSNISLRGSNIVNTYELCYVYISHLISSLALNFWR
jgi:hypothetical protein